MLIYHEKIVKFCTILYISYKEITELPDESTCKYTRVAKRHLRRTVL